MCLCGAVWDRHAQELNSAALAEQLHPRGAAADAHVSVGSAHTQDSGHGESGGDRQQAQDVQMAVDDAAVRPAGGGASLAVLAAQAGAAAAAGPGT